MQELYVATLGAVWFAHRAGNQVVLDKVTGKERSFVGGCLGLTDDFGAVVYQDAIPRELPEKVFRPDEPGFGATWKGNTTPIVGLFSSFQTASSYVDSKAWNLSVPMPETETIIQVLTDRHEWVIFGHSAAKRLFKPGVMIQRVGQVKDVEPDLPKVEVNSSGWTVCPDCSKYQYWGGVGTKKNCERCGVRYQVAPATAPSRSGSIAAWSRSNF